MSEKSCKIFEVSQFGKNQCSEVVLCSSSISCESCAGSYTNEISLPLKEEPFQSGDVTIEQSQNVHVGQKTLYENCHIRVVQYLNDLSEISTIIKDTSESEIKTGNFQRINTNIENKYKLWMRKDSGQVTIIFGIFILLLIASVLLAMFLNAFFLPATESETPTTTDAPKKNQCPVVELSISRIDLVSDPVVPHRKIYNGHHRMIRREGWNASVYEYERVTLENPEYMIVSHTLQQPCVFFEQCVERVQTLQKFDRTRRKLDDIRYNFLIGGNGDIFEGRGWDVVGQHTENYNNRSLGIAFILDSNENKFKLRQKYAFRWLLEEGVRNKKINKNYKLIGRCQVVFSTKSPGFWVYSLIQQQDHWINDPFEF